MDPATDYCRKCGVAAAEVVQKHTPCNHGSTLVGISHIVRGRRLDALAGTTGGNVALVCRRDDDHVNDAADAADAAAYSTMVFKGLKDVKSLNLEGYHAEWIDETAPKITGLPWPVDDLDPA